MSRGMRRVSAHRRAKAMRRAALTEPPPTVVLAHINWIAGEVERLVKSGQKEKAKRWLWAVGYATRSEVTS